jgi:septal ring-binding cell division protein DamX
MKTAFDVAGDIRAVDLLAAFVMLWREEESGSLRFSRGASTAGYDVADGDIVAVFSSEPRFETAAILVRAGKLEASALERLSTPPGTDAALAALQAGLLTRREWKWGEKIRAIEILADLLGWPDGKYIFDRDARPERGEFLLTIPRLLLELFLRSRDRSLVEHQLGPTDVPLLRSDRFDDEFATFGLTADAESVVRLIDGRATATEISERAPAEEFAVLKLLAALTTLGLLRSETALSESAEARSPGEGSQPPPPFESWSDRAPTAAVEEPSAVERVPDVPLEEAAAPLAPLAPESLWEPAPVEPAIVSDPRADWSAAAPEWEERATLDRPLLVEPDPLQPATRSRRPWRLIAGTLVFLLAAVVGTVLIRSRSSRGAASPPAGARPTAAPAVQAPSPIPTVAPLVTPLPAAPAALSVPSLRKPQATAASPGHPAASPTTAFRSEESATARSTWLDRARRDRRRLGTEKTARYAIQLELVCETPSLAEAWKHDRPADSLWLLVEKHQGRECFRVLWGRYQSIEAARRAKSGVPSYFVTSTNHPAVVGVR